MPSAEPTRPKSRPSPRNAAKIWRGATPTVFSTPTSLRRRRIEMRTVL
jgi:hypothetical protein